MDDEEFKEPISFMKVMRDKSEPSRFKASHFVNFSGLTSEQRNITSSLYTHD